MSDSLDSLHDCRLSANITQAMFDRLEHIAKLKKLAKSELVREAIRFYLDEQEDLAGSRKHFTKAFQRRVDYLEWQAEVLMQMLSYLAVAVAKMSSEKSVDQASFLRYAIQKAAQADWESELHNGWLLHEQRKRGKGRGE